MSLPLTVNTGLEAAGASSPDRRAALALLALLAARMEPQSYASGAELPELARQLDLPRPEFQRVVGLLCQVGAVAHGHHKRQRRLFLTPNNAR